MVSAHAAMSSFDLWSVNHYDAHWLDALGAHTWRMTHYTFIGETHCNSLVHDYTEDNKSLIT